MKHNARALTIASASVVGVAQYGFSFYLVGVAIALTTELWLNLKEYHDAKNTAL